MPVPKRKTSKSKRNMRLHANFKATGAAYATCPECGEATKPHNACPSCGNYRGRSVISKDAE